MLRVPRIEFPDYPSCKHLWIVSKDELMAAFCERPSDWDDRQFTQCRPFGKGPRFINMVMTSPPPLVTSNSKDEDDDDGDDDNASNHADAEPMRCLLDILTLCHS